MYKKYQFPIFLFIILEKSSLTFWTSKVLNPNHFICLIDKSWIYLLNQVIKNELFLAKSALVENSSIDTINFSNRNFLINFFSKHNRNLVYYSYYMYFIKMRLTFLFLTNSNGNSVSSGLNSVDKIYKNANWLERETSEMYGVYYYWKTDTRKLLLDYSKFENPLLKDFPSEGFQDVFYNFFENQVTVNKNEVVEL
jgi:NADH:ubiquinone oxidoreductase subunit C